MTKYMAPQSYDLIHWLSDLLAAYCIALLCVPQMLSWATVSLGWHPIIFLECLICSQHAFLHCRARIDPLARFSSSGHSRPWHERLLWCTILLCWRSTVLHGCHLTFVWWLTAQWRVTIVWRWVFVSSSILKRSFLLGILQEFGIVWKGIN